MIAVQDAARVPTAWVPGCTAGHAVPAWSDASWVSRNFFVDTPFCRAYGFSAGSLPARNKQMGEWRGEDAGTGRKRGRERGRGLWFRLVPF